MSHCHNEDSEHDHDHASHHDHSDDLTPALQNLLYEQVDFGAVVTLNESILGSGASILRKTWTQRLDPEPELRSEADEQLLMTVPFTGQVRLHSIILRTSSSVSAPKTLKVFINREDLDFATASDLEATQKIDLAQTSEIQEHSVKRALFNTTRNLSLFFEDNFGDGEEDVTRISYIAFKGNFMRLTKEPISFLYEAAANPSDHVALPGIKGTMQSGVSQGPGM